MKKVFVGECLVGGDANQGQVLMNALQTYTEKVLVASEVSERGLVCANKDDFGVLVTNEDQLGRSFSFTWFNLLFFCE